MAFPIKKIIVYRDYVNKYHRIEVDLNESVISPYVAGEYQLLIPSKENQKQHRLKQINNPLFNTSGLTKIIESIGKHGVLYLELRPKHALGEIICEPDNLNMDIYYSENKTLIYAFYNNHMIDSISIIASLIQDIDNIYDQIKSEPKDIIWRQSFVRQAVTRMESVEDKKNFYPDLMTAPQLAKYLQVTEKTIRNKTNKKEIPVEKIGGIARYRKSKIDSLLEDGKLRKK
jgi:excisionase family DNA binding protein